MTTKYQAISDAVSRIERAPNVRLLIAAYDAALGGSDLSVHRHQGQWQVWHGKGSGLCASFGQVRAHLATKAEEILDHAAAVRFASDPAMVAQPVQQQQASAAPSPSQEDDIPFPKEVRSELVLASDAQVHIMLAGVAAERRGEDRRAAEIAAAASLPAETRGGLTDAEIDAILEELIDADPQGDQWLVEASVGARLADARKVCCERMAALTELLQRQAAGETVDQAELANLRFFLGRDFYAISHMERIEAMGDIGRWLIFVGSESYTLSSADRRHHIALPRTVDREGVLLAIRLAESGTPACDLNECPARMQDAIEIAAIGDVGDGLSIHSSRHGLDVYEDGVDDPMLTLPRGIEPGMARLVVRTHVNAWGKAWEAGQSEGVRLTRADMCRVLGLRVAA